MVLTTEQASLRKKLQESTGPILVVSFKEVLVGSLRIFLSYRSRELEVTDQRIYIHTSWIPDSWERISNAIIDHFHEPTSEALVLDTVSA